MPGLAGIVSNGAPFLNPLAAVEVFRTVGLVNGVSYRYRAHCDGNAAVLNTLTGLLPGSLDQPATHGDARLFLEGEILNLEEVRRAAGCPAAATACEALLALFLERGERFTESLNGEFNIVIWRDEQKRLDLFCDHVASMPMYYMEHAGCLLFGSEKKFLLAVLERPPVLDHLGLLQIIAHRHNLGERTFLDGVRRLQPGAHLVHAGGATRLSHHRLLHWQVPQRVPSAAALCAEWGEQLTMATRRRIAGKGRICFSLSGGLDTRALVCTLPDELGPIASRTRGIAGSPEADVAAEIAATYGFDHMLEDPYAVPFSSMISRIVWRTECETSFMNTVGISHHAVIRDRCDFLLGGWLGDLSSGQRIATPMLRPLSRHIFIETLFHRNSQPESILARVFTKELLAKYLPEVEAEFYSSFGDTGGDGLTNIQAYETWDLYQRQVRQTTSSMPVDSYLFGKIRPFYDRQYLQFTMRLPTRLRYGQSLYQAMIWRQGAAIRHVPCANNGLRLRRTMAGNLLNKVLTVVGRTAPQRIRRRLMPASGEAVERQRGEDPGTAIREDAGFRSLIERFLMSSDCDPAVFNREGIRGLVAEHYAGAADRAYILGHVATMAAGLPYFLHKTPSCPPEAEPLAPLPTARVPTEPASGQAQAAFN